MPKRIQRRRTKGWRMPEGAIYVGRPTRWGNPYRVTGMSADARAAGRAELPRGGAGLVRRDHRRHPPPPRRPGPGLLVSRSTWPATPTSCSRSRTEPTDGRTRAARRR
jgi:hypothetical protein